MKTIKITIAILALLTIGLAPVTAVKADNSVKEVCEIINLPGIYGGQNKKCTVVALKTGFINGDLLAASVAMFGLGTTGIAASKYLKSRLLA